MDTNSPSYTDSLHDEIQSLRGELRQMARQSRDEDLQDLRTAMARRRNQAALAADRGAGSRLNHPLLRGLVGALAVLGLVLGAGWVIENYGPAATADLMVSADPADDGGSDGGAPIDTEESPADEPAPAPTFKQPVRVLKPVLETVMERQEYTVRKPVTEVEYEDEDYTFRKPVTEIVYEDEPYKTRRPVTDVVMEDRTYRVWKPVRETTYRDQMVTVQRPSTETVMVNQPYVVQRPVLTTVYYGGIPYSVYQYVSTVENRLTAVQRACMVDSQEVRKVPVDSIRYVEESRVEKRPVERTTFVEETKYRKVPVEKTKYVEETKTRRVPVEKKRYVEETRMRMVPRQVVRYVEQTAELADGEQPAGVIVLPSPASPAPGASSGESTDEEPAGDLADGDTGSLPEDAPRT
ncbi:MAG: hypothetical protein AAGJ46_19235 [Planctomycetota bacterium]